jgi:hypothetical protein
MHQNKKFKIFPNVLQKENTVEFLDTSHPKSTHSFKVAYLLSCTFFVLYVPVHDRLQVPSTKCRFLLVKPTGCANLSNLFLEWNSACFGLFLCPSSGVFHCKNSNGICHKVCWHFASRIRMERILCDIYHYCVYSENFWWWTEELYETYRVSFQE